MRLQDALQQHQNEAVRCPARGSSQSKPNPHLQYYFSIWWLFFSWGGRLLNKRAANGHSFPMETGGYWVSFSSMRFRWVPALACERYKSEPWFVGAWVQSKPVMFAPSAGRQSPKGVKCEIPRVHVERSQGDVGKLQATQEL